MTEQYNYGGSVIEFFPFLPDDLQSEVQSHEAKYYNATTTFAEDNLAANINFREGPIKVALPKLLQLYDAGYTLRMDRFVGEIDGALDVTLMKPQSMIDKDLIQVHANAEEMYSATRWLKNSVETQRQLNISLQRAERDAEKARVAAEQAAAEAQRQRALDELRQAYAA